MFDVLLANWFYGLILLVSLTSLTLLDYHRKIVLFAAKPKRQNVTWRAGLTTTACLVVLFLLWDISGVVLDIFSTNQRFVLGIFIGHADLPIEEVGFLTLLSYVTLLTYELVSRFVMRKQKS